MTIHEIDVLETSCLLLYFTKKSFNASADTPQSPHSIAHLTVKIISCNTNKVQQTSGQLDIMFFLGTLLQPEVGNVIVGYAATPEYGSFKCMNGDGVTVPEIKRSLPLCNQHTVHLKHSFCLLSYLFAKKTCYVHSSVDLSTVYNESTTVSQ